MTEVFGSGSGGSSGHAIVDESGTVYPERSNLKFINASITDDAVNDVTIVEVEGGGAVIKIGDVEGESATSTPGTASVVIKWTDPEDIVVSGATLAEWAGTKVVRKIGSAPSSVSDGTVVVDSTTKNAYSSAGYTDSGLTYGETYYYRFFPYTTQGAVTDGSSVNVTPDRASVAVPTFTATMTYNGSQQTAAFTGYDSTKMTVSGNTGTNVGSYTAKFNVKPDYKWSDGTREEKSVTWAIGKKSVTVPTLSGTYTYTGSTQSVTISSYSSSEVTVGGDYSATNAGTYTVTFNLADANNLKWSDGTTAQKTASWTIDKAEGSVTLSASSVTLNPSNTSVTVTASGATGGLGVTSSDKNVATAHLNGSTITINSVNNTNGTATINVSVAGSTNYKVTSKKISVTASFATLVSWSSGTDAQIKAMIDAYYNGSFTLAQVKSVWSVGQSRSVNLSAMSATGVRESHRAQTVEMQIIDFDHDILATPINGKTKALVTVQFKAAFRDAIHSNTEGSMDAEIGYMHSTANNSAGWNGCARRTWCNSVLYNALPTNFKSWVKSVKKSTAKNGGSTSPVWYANHDYCFLLSEMELFGKQKNSAETGTDASHTDVDANNASVTMPAGGTRYSFFTTTNNKYREPRWNDQTGTVSAFYWLRSPSKSNNTHYCDLFPAGSDNTSHNSASDELAIIPAMCI